MDHTGANVSPWVWRKVDIMNRPDCERIAECNIAGLTLQTFSLQTFYGSGTKSVLASESRPRPPRSAHLPVMPRLRFKTISRLQEKRPSAAQHFWVWRLVRCKLTLSQELGSLLGKGNVDIDAGSQFKSSGGCQSWDDLKVPMVVIFLLILNGGGMDDIIIVGILQFGIESR